jgi:hypothetical protein
MRVWYLAGLPCFTDEFEEETVETVETVEETSTQLSPILEGTVDML